MIVTKKHLPRRTFLRGCGVALALPLLDGMIPAFAKPAEAAAAQAPTRLGFVYVPNGIMDLKGEWTPAAEGAGFEFTRTLQALSPFRERLLILSGLSHNEARVGPGESGGDHSRASASYLTGIHPKMTEGADIKLGTSVDQMAAKELGKGTQLASLELSVDPVATAGACDAGWSCTYENTLSWRNSTTPLPAENDPRVVFERLFGDSGSTDPKVRMAQIRSESSILDFITQDSDQLSKGLGASDRTKLGEYLDAIRDVERRINLAEQQASRKMPVVSQPVGIPDTFEEHAKLMFDLQVLAYQVDLSRVTTFLMGHEQSVRPYPEIGIPDAHHPLSHHGGDPAKIEKVIQINTFHIKMFAYFLEKLRTTPDGDGSLLDHCLLLYGSGLSDGNAHLHNNLPMLVAGGANGRMKGGRHLRYATDTPMPRLYGTLLDAVGVPLDNLGSNGAQLEPLSIA